MKIEGLLDLIGNQLLDHLVITQDGKVQSEFYQTEVFMPDEYKGKNFQIPVINKENNIRGIKYNHFELDLEMNNLGIERNALMVAEELINFTRYHAFQALIGENISNETKIMKHFKVALHDLPNEHLYITTFDNNYDIQKIHNVSIGRVSSTILEPIGCFKSFIC